MRRSTGFTLVELVMVIVLLAIIAAISVQFVTLATRGALDVGTRQQRALQSVVVSEQVSRELRSAFPLSVRTAGTCIEWLPIEGVTTYAGLTRGPGFDDITVVPFATVPPVGNTRALVYGYGSATNDLYDAASPGPVSTPISAIDNGVSPAVMTLDGAHRFSQRSPSGGCSLSARRSACARVAGFSSATAVTLSVRSSLHRRRQEAAKCWRQTWPAASISPSVPPPFSAAPWSVSPLPWKIPSAGKPRR